MAITKSKYIKFKKRSCPYCSSNAKIILKTICFKNKNISVSRCKKCDFVYLDHQLSKLQDLYNENYWEAENTINDKVEKYNESQYFRIKKTINIIKKYSKNKTVCILDVGCGDGRFMKSAKSFFEVSGIEFDKKMKLSVIDKNLDIRYGKFEKMTFKKKYDIVFLSHVIEHLPNPNLYLKKIHQILKPSGLLFILCPNEINSIFSKISNFSFISKYLHRKLSVDFEIRNKIPILSYNENSNISEKLFIQIMFQHLSFFSPSSLNKFLIQNNFLLKKSICNKVLKGDSWFINIIKNNIINYFFKLFNMHEEIFFIAKKKIHSKK